MTGSLSTMRVMAFIGYDKADQLGVFYVDRDSAHLRDAFRTLVESESYRASLEDRLNELALDPESDLFLYAYVGNEMWERVAAPEVPVELAVLADPNAEKQRLVMLSHVDFATAETLLFDVEVGILGWSSAYPRN